jgi:Ca2+-binding EF-hand superfamily protein
VSSIFRKFDRKSKGTVTFSDFAFTIEEIGLKFSREIMIQLFDFLDRDHDGFL